MRPWWALMLVPLAGCLSDAPQEAEETPVCTAPEGLSCSDEDGTFTVSGTSAQTEGPWLLLVDTPRLVLEDLQGPGMQVVCHPRACDVEVRNVTLSGHDNAGLRFSHLNHGQYVHIGNMSIQGLTVDAPGARLVIGELGPMSSLVVGDLRLRCHGKGGVTSTVFQTMTFQGVHLEDCRQFTVHGNGSRAVSLELRDATLHGSGLQLMAMHGTAMIENLTVSEAEQALLAWGEGPFKVDIIQSAFTDNQHGIRLMGGDMRIRGSSFAGTQGQAVCTPTGATVDATDNWWGSPAGPVPGIAGVFVPGAPVETVCAGVVTTPHRTSP